MSTNWLDKSRETVSILRDIHYDLVTIADAAITMGNSELCRWLRDLDEKTKLAINNVLEIEGIIVREQSISAEQSTINMLGMALASATKEIKEKNEK